DFLRTTPGASKILSVGKKGALFFGKRGYSLIGENHVIASAGATYDDAVAVTKAATEMYINGEVDAVYLCYSKFYSPIRQVPQVVQLLPIEPPKGEDGKAAGAKEYTFEPAPTELLSILLPKYVLTLTYQSLLEATASEFGARMTAMTSATDNAGKMIDSLTLKANRERQASITKEILEVVGGAEALKG
ncbi:MAG: F0F1 ATP synthase subunit gamma, partial [Chthonomonas sp.]|nr:F0F1 ATP synthase subunit gamma [Chthonomonas sp.]